MKKLNDWCAIAFAAAFTLYFFTTPLYNSAPKDEQRITRLELLLWTTYLDESNPLVDFAGRMTPLSNLPQRLPIALPAAALMLTALAAGDLLLGLSFKRNRLIGLDRFVFAYALGTGIVSLYVLLAGLAGALVPWTVAVTGGLVLAGWGVRQWRAPELKKAAMAIDRPPAWLIVVALPFVAVSLLAAMIPTPDYDALAYHLLGPKEWHLAGRIEFLPHNVYTTFPFFTEMFSLLGMTIADDWFLGGLIGQTVLWSFGPAGALATVALGRRLFGPQTGWLAGAVYITTPWVYRLSTIPYVEGALLFFTVVAIDAALRTGLTTRPEQRHPGTDRSGKTDEEIPLPLDNGPTPPWGMLAGLAAGFAFSCKYTGLFTTVVPVATLVVIACVQTGNWRPLACLFLGLAIAATPWLARNLVWTGNPVFPLANSVFQSPAWSAEQAERFRKGHKSTDFGLHTVMRYVVEIPVTSDWQSGLTFAFAPLALLGARRRQAGGLLLLVAYLFLVFWGLTHRLDRFWLPLLPFVILLAAAGMRTLIGDGYRSFCLSLIAVTFSYNFVYCTSGLCGIHTYAADLARQRELRVQSEPVVAIANSDWIPADAKILYVGYAAVYYASPPALYNTVFDRNWLVEWSFDASGQLKPIDAIRAELVRHDVEFILVDWNWIRQYRSPGNYGFPEEVTPELFTRLEQAGLIREEPAVSRLTNKRVQMFAVRRHGLD